MNNSICNNYSTVTTYLTITNSFLYTHDWSDVGRIGNFPYTQTIHCAFGFRLTFLKKIVGRKILQVKKVKSSNAIQVIIAHIP